MHEEAFHRRNSFENVSLCGTHFVGDDYYNMTFVLEHAIHHARESHPHPNGIMKSHSSTVCAGLEAR